MARNKTMMCFRFSCAVLMLCVLMLCVLMLGGCAAQKVVYVPTETASVSNDSTVKVRVVDRLIIERDTLNTYVLGDTIIKESIKWRIREVAKTDTLFRAKTDTLRVANPYPVEITKEVERNLHWWQQTLIYIGIAALGIVAIAIIVFFIKKKRIKF